MAKEKLVVLTGAGISAESGLRTFRDSDGLWEGYDVEEVATFGAWQRNPQLVLEFYNMRRRQVMAASPNAAHTGLAKLETEYEVYIITQNIDDLHERAGSTQVLHLHGEILKMRSSGDDHLISRITGDIQLGDRAEDGGQWRPHIVWFGEPVYMMETAIPLVQQADLFAVVGTSLVVYPAAGLLQYAPAHIDKYLIDKKIPYTSRVNNLQAIEMPATLGVAEMVRRLRNGAGTRNQPSN